jgi:SAM-dependent methyltransferase
MLGHLRIHCAPEIAAGTVREILMPPQGMLDAVTANFAVLNLVNDRPGLFRTLHRSMKPGGTILLSLINPYFLGDAKYPWWRANLGRLIGRGVYSVPGPAGSVDRITPRRLVAEAQPGYRLVRTVPGVAGLPFEPFFFVQLARRP